MYQGIEPIFRILSVKLEIISHVKQNTSIILNKRVAYLDVKKYIRHNTY